MHLFQFHEQLASEQTAIAIVIVIVILFSEVEILRKLSFLFQFQLNRSIQ